MSTAARSDDAGQLDDATDGSLRTGASSHSAPAASTGRVALEPRWLWIAFALVALAVPVIGLWLERAP